MRMLCALPFFVVVAVWYPDETWPPAPLSQVAAISAVGMLGIMSRLGSTLPGLHYISAGLERMVVYLYPSCVVAIAWVKGDKPSPAVLSCLLITYAGIVLCCVGEVHLGGQVWLGSALVAGSAIAFAFYLHCSPLSQRHGSTRFTALAFSAAATASFCINWCKVNSAAWHNSRARYGSLVPPGHWLHGDPRLFNEL